MFIVKSIAFFKKKHTHCEIKRTFENHWKKVDIELNSNFQLLHRYVTKIFCISYFQENIWECFKAQLSVAVSLNILSRKGANQLQVLYMRTLGNIQGNFSSESAVFKCIPNFFLEICRSFRTTAKKLALKNYVLAYHTADKNHAKIL